MPSPKDGQPGAAIPPDAPNSAHEADNADPGEVDTVKAEQQKSQKGKYGSAKTKPHQPPETEEEREDKASWVELELVDRKGKPVPGEPYQVTLPDGETVAEGTLDDKGFARVDGIDSGTCKITFPRLEKQAWKPK